MEQIQPTPSSFKLVQSSFFQQDNVVAIAHAMLGMKISTTIDQKEVSGIICETEAYEGVIDKACHAYGGRRTARTETLYAEGGTLYVYLCYGIHHLVNVVTHRAEHPHAVLLRGIFPFTGIQHMMARRKVKQYSPLLAIGPGKMSQALGITLDWNGSFLPTPQIKIHHAFEHTFKPYIQSGPRIGVDYAGEHAKWPYRFWVNHPDVVTFLKIKSAHC